MTTLRLDGDASGAVRATDEVRKSAVRLDEQYKQINLTAEQMQEQLKRAFDETKMERYVRQVGDLDKKFKEGKISAYQYADEVNKLDAGMKKAGQSSEESFATMLKGTIGNITAMVSLGAAIQVVTRAIQKQAEEKEKALAADQATQAAAGQLSAAGGTSADLAFARQLAAQGTFKDDNEAIRAVTQFRQQGLTGSEQQYMAKVADEELVATGQAGEYAAGVQTFRRAQKGRAGTFESTEAKIRAAGKASRFGPEEIALSAANIADVGAEAGVSPDEQLAMLVTQAGRRKNIKRGASEVEAMLKGGERISGDDYDQALAAIRSSGGVEKSLVHTDDRLNLADAAGDARARRESRGRAMRSEKGGIMRLIHERELEASERYYGTGVVGAIQEASLDVSLMGQQAVRGEAALARNISNLSPEAAAARGYSPEDQAMLRRALQRLVELAEKKDRETPPPNGKQE